MRITQTLPVATLALALTLGACSGAETETDGDEATEETAEANDAVEHPADGYITDDSGRLENEMGGEGFAPINARLAQHHTDTGQHIHIVTIMQLEDGETIESAAAERLADSDADAMIYLSGRDESVVAVGEGIDDAEGEAIGQSIADRLNMDENFSEAFNDGITATAEAMSN